MLALSTERHIVVSLIYAASIFMTFLIVGCGYSVTDPIPSVTRIVGGQEVNPPHRLPYQALVMVSYILCIS